MRNYLYLLLILFYSNFTKAQSSLLLGIQTSYSNIVLTNANLIADGNSYVQGNGYTPFSTYIMQTNPFNSNGSTMKNFGVGGQTTPQMISDENSQVLSQYVSGKTNILFVVEGGNDIYYNGNVDSAVAHYRQYCNAAKAAGFKVIVSTTIPRNNPTPAYGGTNADYNLKLSQFNSAVIADNSFYDGIIRPELEDIFQTYSSGGYDADQIHPNVAGQQRFAKLFVTVMQHLINK